jgi:hypothetical protein
MILKLKQVLCVFYKKDDGGDFLGVLHMKWEQVLVTTHWMLRASS